MFLLIFIMYEELKDIMFREREKRKDSGCGKGLESLMQKIGKAFQRICFRRETESCLLDQHLMTNW